MSIKCVCGHESMFDKREEISSPVWFNQNGKEEVDESAEVRNNSKYHCPKCGMIYDSLEELKEGINPWKKLLPKFLEEKDRTLGNYTIEGKYDSFSWMIDFYISSERVCYWDSLDKEIYIYNKKYLNNPKQINLIIQAIKAENYKINQVKIEKADENGAYMEDIGNNFKL